MTSETTSHSNARLSLYLNLDPPLREVVALVAVNFAPLGLREIKSTLGFSFSQKLNLDPAVAAGLLQRFKSGAEKVACPPEWLDLILRHLTQAGELARFVELAHVAWPLESHWPGMPRSRLGDLRFESGEQFIREIRIALYEGDEGYIDKIITSFRKHATRYWREGWSGIPSANIIGIRALLNPYDAAWFASIPDHLKRRFLPGILIHLSARFGWTPETLKDLKAWALQLGIPSGSLVFALLEIGHLPEAMALSREIPESDPERWAIEGIFGLLNGDRFFGLSAFEEALKCHRKATGEKKAVLPGIFGIFHCFALLLEGTQLSRLRILIKQADEWRESYPSYSSLEEGLELATAQVPSTRFLSELLLIKYEHNPKAPDILTFWLGLLMILKYEENPSVLGALSDLAQQMAQHLRGQGLLWPALEFEILHARFQGQGSAAKDSRLKDLEGEWTLLTDRVQYEAPWEKTLRAIEQRFPPKANIEEKCETKPAKPCRLAWFVEHQYGQRYLVEPREQKLNSKGWTKGRLLSVQNLIEERGFESEPSAQDREIIRHIRQGHYYRSFHLEEGGWKALVGHPAVFDHATGQTLEIEVVPPELRIQRETNHQVRISLWPIPQGEESLVFHRLSATTLRVTPIRNDHRRLLESIGNGFVVPESQHTRLIESLKGIAALVTIHSDLGTVDIGGIEAVSASTKPRLQLSQEGEGLNVCLQMRPFDTLGPYFPPGSGPKSLITESQGQRLQTQRDLQAERVVAMNIQGTCPSLSATLAEGAGWTWFLDSADASLEFLLELQSLPSESLDIEWPKGKKIEVLGEASPAKFNIRIGQQRDWFAVSGELETDHGEVILLQTLLELTDNAQHRFIRLDGDRFLALTASLKKRLDDLRSLTEGQGASRKVHPLALSLLEGMAPEFQNFETDEAFKTRILQLKEALTAHPALPSTLTATLRDYQLEGYVWLSRLAAWGVGACLADDMGLGKTVQTIALILSRAAKGPTLIIAPTSVVFNWHNEIRRFAPTLHVQSLVGDRKAQIEGLGPFDVLVISYGLLQQESVLEPLLAMRYRTLVLDEAQAIKNTATQRSKAVMALQSDFRIALTGTPIENHLGELWNLFRFLNPGLLGSEASFNKKYAFPIERNGSRDAKHRLRQLIQPFFLRRTKSEVLDELPERTEIELKVVLTGKEAAFYEALRKKLVQEIEDSDPLAEDRRFKVLVALTQLRRACCNPNLIAPDLELASSKLELLGTVVDELLENRHKALIFSQFVDHLELIRKSLDQRGVHYQYLDGRTPPAERKRRVEAFQSGEGDVFLISLKAGGSGLNLTAADYVIHLDPWWNPAVEDQASSRAHRMGQERPVTVYRLITQGTIEEQIVGLHKSKRELAESLLEGGDVSGRMDSDELLALMRAGALNA